jgi:hypothetical protein
VLTDSFVSFFFFFFFFFFFCLRVFFPTPKHVNIVPVHTVEYTTTNRDLTLFDLVKSNSLLLVCPLHVAPSPCIWCLVLVSSV